MEKKTDAITAQKEMLSQVLEAGRKSGAKISLKGFIRPSVLEMEDPKSWYLDSNNEVPYGSPV
jgi:hypothetical protein